MANFLPPNQIQIQIGLVLLVLTDTKIRYHYGKMANFCIPEPDADPNWVGSFGSARYTWQYVATLEMEEIPGVTFTAAFYLMPRPLLSCGGRWREGRKDYFLAPINRSISARSCGSAESFVTWPEGRDETREGPRLVYVLGRLVH